MKDARASDFIAAANRGEFPALQQGGQGNPDRRKISQSPGPGAPAPQAPATQQVVAQPPVQQASATGGGSPPSGGNNNSGGSGGGGGGQGGSPQGSPSSGWGKFKNDNPDLAKLVVMGMAVLSVLGALLLVTVIQVTGAWIRSKIPENAPLQPAATVPVIQPAPVPVQVPPVVSIPAPVLGQSCFAPEAWNTTAHRPHVIEKGNCISVPSQNLPPVCLWIRTSAPIVALSGVERISSAQPTIEGGQENSRMLGSCFGASCSVFVSANRGRSLCVTQSVNQPLSMHF